MRRCCRPGMSDPLRVLRVLRRGHLTIYTLALHHTPAQPFFSRGPSSGMGPITRILAGILIGILTGLLGSFMSRAPDLGLPVPWARRLE